MKRTVSGVVVVACALVLAASIARAHDGEDAALEAKFRAALVSDADTGDLSVGSADGSFIRLDAEDGGRVKMGLAGVTDTGGLPADAAGCQLTVTGLVDGVPFSQSFAFDLVAGGGSVHDSLGLGDGNLLEIQTVAASCPPAGVFAVPGLAADDDDDHDGPGHGFGHGGHHGWGRGHGHHGDLVAAHRQGDDGDEDDAQGDDDDQGDDDHHHGGGHGHGRHRGLGKFRTSLVGDADAGDYGVDSAMGGFVTIDEDKVSMRIAGVTDGTGTPVDHAGNQLVVTGLGDGTPFTVTFPFDLVAGAGKVCGRLGVDADVVEIQTVTLTDGTTVFAVPGFLVRGDDGDDDGVPDGEDACSDTGTSTMVSADGCSLGQRCACSLKRGALRACLRLAAKDVKHHLRASCVAKTCRQRVRALMQERRSVLRSCR